MVDLLLHVLFNSLICLALFVLYTPDMLLSFVGDKLDGWKILSETRQGNFWRRTRISTRKPLGACLTCMASIYGTAYWLIFMQSTFVWYLIFPYLLALTAANFILNTLVVARA